MTRSIRNLLEKLMGIKAEFSLEHRFLNFACFFSFIANLVSFAGKAILGFSAFLLIVTAAGAVAFAALFYVSRWRKKFESTIYLYFFVMSAVLTLVWFSNAGTAGPVLFYYFSQMMLLMFLLSGVNRVLALFFVFINVIVLMVIEYHEPRLIFPYPNLTDRVVDVAIGIFYNFFMIIALVLYAKRNYRDQKAMTEMAVDKLRRELDEKKTTEEQLKRQNNFIMSIFSASPGAIFSLDLNGKFVDCNQRGLGIFGFATKEEISGIYLSDLLTDREKEHLESQISQTRESGSTQDVHYHILSGTGERMVIGLSLSLVRDETGLPSFFTGVTSDVTEQMMAEGKLESFRVDLEKMLRERTDELQVELTFRKRAELELVKKHNLFKSVLDFSPKGVAITEHDGTIMDCNRAIADLLNTSSKEGAIGGNFFDLLLTNSSTEAKDRIRGMLLNGSDRNVEHQYAKPDGTLAFVDLKAGVVKDNAGKVLYYILMATDITGQKEYENNLRQTSDKLSTLNATKDKFFSIIAHDLKDPFNAIIGFSDLLYKEFDNFNEDEKRSFIKNIKESAESVYKLLQNLLEWSRSQTGKMDYRPIPIDLQVLVKDVIMPIKPQADNKSIAIIPGIENDVLVYADENMLKTILRNLISNAVKFTYKGGSVSITSQKSERLTANGEHMVEVSITDTGMGIPSEYIDKLFKLDEKIKSRGTNEEQGSGLGLILCKELIEKNKGTISVKSEFGKGSEFIICLP
ncbi:MAG: PAS domain-containing sensor histidine kinase, partial [Bacteroidota bacterium]